MSSISEGMFVQKSSKPNRLVQFARIIAWIALLTAWWLAIGAVIVGFTFLMVAITYAFIPHTASMASETPTPSGIVMNALVVSTTAIVEVAGFALLFGLCWKELPAPFRPPHYYDIKRWAFNSRKVAVVQPIRYSGFGDGSGGYGEECGEEEEDE